MPLHRPAPPSAALRWAAPLALLLSAASAPAEEFYYLTMFGSQTSPMNPNYSHTFAVFVRACGEGPCPDAYVVEDSFCISWLPANMVVRTRALLPECGHNFGLHETLRYVLSSDERVSVWGPYRIEKDLYDGAVEQYHLLESGEVRYKAVDSGYPTDRVSNCIHAVASAGAGWRVRVLSPWFGETATWAVLQRFRPYIIDPDRTHEWVYSYLGLEGYPLVRREFENPQSGPVMGLLKEAVGAEP